MMHLRGDGFEKNLQRAAELMTSAAERGLAIAQYHLGLMYSNGEGVSRDLIQAYKWADLAVKSPDAGAPDLREFLANMMTSDQVVEAQRMSSEWKPKTK
jgi:TPR repeat protein